MSGERGVTSLLALCLIGVVLLAALGLAYAERAAMQATRDYETEVRLALLAESSAARAAATFAPGGVRAQQGGFAGELVLDTAREGELTCQTIAQCEPQGLVITALAEGAGTRGLARTKGYQRVRLLLKKKEEGNGYGDACRLP